MADNVIIPVTGTGDAQPTIAAEDIAGVKHQRVKVEWGAAGVATDVSAANPLPISVASVPTHGVTGPLTDAELRATPVPVSGTVTASGPLTDAQLRATPVPVSGSLGGTQYTEGDTDATIAGTAMLMEGAANALVPAQGTAADGLLVNLGANNDVTVTGSVTATGPLTDAELRAVAVPVSAASLPLPTGAATLAGQTQPGVDIGDVTINNAAGAAAVNIQDGGNTITVDGTVTANLAAGTNNIGDVDVLTVPADPFGVNADAASAAGSISAKLRFIASTGIPVTALPALAAGTANIGDVDVLSLPALVAGTANIGDVDVASIAAGDNNIGNVDIVTMPNVTLAAGTNTNEVVGDVADGVAAAGNPLSIGLTARTTNRTPVSDGQSVRAIGDDMGRQVMVVGQVRDLMVHQHTQIASSSSETTILTAAASTFHDLTQLVITNETATAVTVNIKDATAGTTRLIVALAASGGAVIPFHRPLTQAATNGNWTATLSSAAVTVNFLVQAEKNV